MGNEGYYFYSSNLCNLECPEGRYGQNCTEMCQCKNGARCNKVTGCCSCPVGYYGSTCQFRKEKKKC